LAIMARPRAGDWLEDAIARWRDAGIDIVVSLLEPAEIAELGLEPESGLCREYGIQLIPFPIRDRALPRYDSQAGAPARRGAAEQRGGQAVGDAERRAAHPARKQLAHRRRAGPGIEAEQQCYAQLAEQDRRGPAAMHQIHQRP